MLNSTSLLVAFETKKYAILFVEVILRKIDISLSIGKYMGPEN